MIARETGDRSDEETALWNKALVLDQLEDRAQATAHAEAALAIYEQIESPHAEMVRGTLAEWKAGDGADQGDADFQFFLLLSNEHRAGKSGP